MDWMQHFREKSNFEHWKRVVAESLDKEQLKRLFEQKTFEGIELNALDFKRKTSLKFSTKGEGELGLNFSQKVLAKKALEMRSFNSLKRCYLLDEQLEGMQTRTTLEKLNPLSKGFLIDLTTSFKNLNYDWQKLSDLLNQKREVLSQNQILLDISFLHDAGASAVQELALAISLYHECLQKKAQLKVVLQIASSGQYFTSIAKLRSLRYLLERLDRLHQVPHQFSIHTVNSKREQTLYDPWVNMLRNTTCVAAALIGGADVAFVSAYNELVHEQNDLEAMRVAINSAHVLKEESKLSSVSDPACGSFALERMSVELIKKSWELFVDWQKNNVGHKNMNELAKEIEEKAHQRWDFVARRKTVITGVNQYANPSDSLSALYHTQVKLATDDSEPFPLRRLAWPFEKARYQLELSKSIPNVTLLIAGSRAKLSARTLFAQDLFEIMGAKVSEVFYEKTQEKMATDVVALICEDGDYARYLSEVRPLIDCKRFFIATKKSDEYQNVEFVYMGMNVLHFVESFVEGGAHE